MRWRGMRKPADCSAGLFEDKELRDSLPCCPQSENQKTRPALTKLRGAGGAKPPASGSVASGGLILFGAVDLLAAGVVPGRERVERVVVRHVAAQGRHRDAAGLDRRVVRPVLARRGEVFLADPVVGFAAWVYVLGDDGGRVLYPLARDAPAAHLARRDVDVEERPFRKSLGQNLARGEDGEARGLGEVEVLARDEAEGEAGHAEDGGFERAGDRAGVGGVVAEVAAVVD